MALTLFKRADFKDGVDTRVDQGMARRIGKKLEHALTDGGRAELGEGGLTSLRFDEFTNVVRHKDGFSISAIRLIGKESGGKKVDVVMDLPTSMNPNGHYYPLWTDPKKCGAHLNVPEDVIRLGQTSGHIDPDKMQGALKLIDKAYSSDHFGTVAFWQLRLGFLFF